MRSACASMTTWVCSSGRARDASANGMQAVLITRGGRGMALFVPNTPTLHIPIFGSDEIADVTGAGDTVMATMALALAAGTTFEIAARLANYAGGIVVMKRGTATASAEEIRHAVRSDTADDVLEAARAWVRSSRARHWRLASGGRMNGRTVAFANGCFDLLHVGHVRYLGGCLPGGRSARGCHQRRSIGQRPEGGGPPCPGGGVSRRAGGGASFSSTWSQCFLSPRWVRARAPAP